MNIQNNDYAYIDVIKDIMANNKLSQQKFADLIGVNQTTVSQWLLGKKKPTYDNIQRLQNGSCSFEAGLYLNELLMNYKRIANHCSNISVGMISMISGSYDTHDYQEHIRKFSESDFAAACDEYSAKYGLNLNP